MTHRSRPPRHRPPPWVLTPERLEQAFSRAEPPPKPQPPNDGLTPAARWKRRQRARALAGLAVYPVEAYGEELAAYLNGQGFPCDPDDRRSVTAALSAFLKRIAPREP